MDEGRQEGEAKATLRPLNRHCPLGDATTTRIQALLDFSGPADLAAWLDDHATCSCVPISRGAYPCADAAGGGAAGG